MYGGSGVGSGIVNGTKVATGTGGQLQNPALGTFLWFGGNNGGGYSNRNFAFFTVSEYLNDTEAANLYTKIQNYQISLGRSVGPQTVSDPDAQLFINTADIQDQIQATAVNYLVTDLKSNNLWTKMKAVYPMVGGNATSNSYNLKNSSQFQITWNGGITHSSSGALFNGTNGYGNTNLVPSSALTLNNTHISFYSRTTNIKNGARDFAVYENGDNPTIALGTNTGVYMSDHYNYNNRISGSIANAQGFFLATRTSSTVHKLFRNGTQLSTTNTTTNTNNLPAQALYIGVENGGSVASVGWSDKQVAFASIGDGLTDTDASNLYTIIQNYQTILNRQV